MSNALERSGKKILFQLSGSIACYKACHVVSRLVQAGHEVQAVCSKSALEFVGKATLEGLSGRPVFTDAFEPGRMMDHIHLSKWADLAILCPASASAINRLAAGLADDAIGTFFLAWPLATKPYLLAPAMNQQMLKHPAVGASLARLEGWGVRVLPTDEGRQACGDEGLGRLMDPEAILKRVERGARAMKGLRVLITSGATREPIDGVRFLTNFSTGRTGAELCDLLAEKGVQVDFISGAGAALPANAAAIHGFTDFASLDRLLKEKLGNQGFDAVIHLAAVSDYSVSAIEEAGRSFPAPLSAKIGSDAPELRLVLRRNFKIVERLKGYSRDPGMLLFAFKLTHGASEEDRRASIEKLARASGADWIIHNELGEIRREPGSHPFTVYAGSDLKKPHASVRDVRGLASILFEDMAMAKKEKE